MFYSRFFYPKKGHAKEDCKVIFKLFETDLKSICLQWNTTKPTFTRPVDIQNPKRKSQATENQSCFLHLLKFSG